MLFIIISYIPYIAAKVLLFGHICKYITGIIAILYKYLSIAFVRMPRYSNRGISIESSLPTMFCRVVLESLRCKDTDFI